MERALCVGCGRTIDEIAGWGMASAAERWAVLMRIAARTGSSATDSRNDETPST